MGRIHGCVITQRKGLVRLNATDVYRGPLSGIHVSNTLENSTACTPEVVFCRLRRVRYGIPRLTAASKGCEPFRSATGDGSAAG